MIKGHFSDHLVLAVKDQIRELRFRIRRSADGDPVRGDERRPSRVPRPVALAANAVFAQVETGARALLPEQIHQPGPLAFPLPLEAYFGAGDGTTEPGQTFTIEIYHALKRLLRRFGAREYLVFEQAIGEAHAEIARQHPDLIAAALAGAPGVVTGPITKLCAALAVQLAAAQPVREMLLDPAGEATPRHLKPTPNDYCACVVGLATAIVSLKLDTEVADVLEGAERTGKDWIVQSADMAVDARFERFAAALKTSDPVAGLAAEFAAVLPFLP